MLLVGLATLHSPSEMISNHIALPKTLKTRGILLCANDNEGLAELASWVANPRSGVDCRFVKTRYVLHVRSRCSNALCFPHLQMRRDYQAQDLTYCNLLEQNSCIGI